MSGSPAGSAPAVVPGAFGFSATEAISYGWRKYGENALQIVLATALLLAVSVGAGIATHAGADRLFDDTGSFSTGGLLAMGITCFVAYVFAAAIIRGALDITDGFDFSVVEAFRTLPYLNVIGMSVLAAVPTALGLAVTDLVGFPVIVLMLFVFFRVVDRDVNAFSAFSDSFEVMADHSRDTWSLVLLSLLAMVAGFLALCVGVLVALPALAISWAYAYRVLRQQPVAP